MYDILVKYKDALEQGKSARTVQFDIKDEQKIAKELFLLTSKPVMYVCNVDEASAATGNKYVEQGCRTFVLLVCHRPSVPVFVLFEYGFQWFPNLSAGVRCQ